MRTYMPKRAIAFQAGYTAASEGRPAVPAQDPAFLELVEELSVGDGVAVLAVRWQRGYALKRTEQAADAVNELHKGLK